MGLFDLHPTVTLYDLTNTFFEGEAARQPMAQRGHSKGTDCPLLALVLDSSGFVGSKVFAATCENTTPSLEALNAPREALVVMDRGRHRGPLQWLRHGYRYLVVEPQFDPDAAQRIETASRQGVHLHKVVSEDGHEARLFCFSEGTRRQGTRHRGPAFLTALSDGLSRPRTTRSRSGGLALRHRTRHRPQRRARHRGLLPPPGRRLDDDPSGGVLPAAIKPIRGPVGTYVTLTDLEAAFAEIRALRPIFHHKPIRAEGHLFISVIAYQLVQLIRRRLREAGD